MKACVLAFGLMFCSLLMGTPMVHRYDFNGGLEDDFAGPALIPVHTATSGFDGGNWFWTATSSPGGGLLMQTTLPDPFEYSLRIVFKYDNFYSTWTKILSFTGFNSANNYFTTDSGLYFYQNRLEFYPYISNEEIPFYPNVWYDLIFTRNSTGLIRIYLCRFGQANQLVLQFDDPNTQAVPSAYNGNYCWGLCYDDTHTTSEWTSGGSIALIELWSQAQVFQSVQNLNISHTGSSIDISWDPYPDALSYNIYVSSDPENAPWELLGNAMGTSTSFTSTFPNRFYYVNAVLP